MSPGFAIAMGFVSLVLIEAVASYGLSNSFFPSQVMARTGRPGISFFVHGGMWGDLIVLPPLAAFIIDRYCVSWSMTDIVVASLVGSAMTLANHLLCIRSPIPDPIGWQGEKWSLAIALHFVYMSAYVALVMLFYFSPGITTTVAVFVSIVLGVHMGFGTHVPLALADRWLAWGWCPELLRKPGLASLSAAIWIALSALATNAAGPAAGLYVLVAAASLAAIVLMAIRHSPASAKAEV